MARILEFFARLLGLNDVQKLEVAALEGSRCTDHCCAPAPACAVGGIKRFVTSPKLDELEQRMALAAAQGVACVERSKHEVREFRKNVAEKKMRLTLFRGYP